MFSPQNRLELRRVNISSLITCIYLPIIITVICYKGFLYSVGKGSSFYVLVLIFVAEVLKSFFLYSGFGPQGKRSRPGRSSTWDITKLTLYVVGTVVFIFIGSILLGAPVSEAHEETLMLAMLLTILTIFPLLVHCGLEQTIQMGAGMRKVPDDTITEMLMDHALLTVCGAWLSAIVIPLDWNKPWQKWPIPCYLGGIGGYLLSNVITALRVTLVTASVKYPCLKFAASFMKRIQIEN